MDALAGSPGRGVLVPNGVDQERFQPRPRQSARDELGLDAAAPVVLVVGHLIARKDPQLALEAAAAMGAVPPTVVFVGTGALEPVLRARAAELGLAEHVRFEGALPPERLERWYAAADCLLLCSHREGRPNVVIEALACGRPVVATRAGGTAELLAGIDGALADSRDPAELGRRVSAVLESPPDPDALRAQVAHLSWEASAEILEELLRSALEDAA